MNDGVPPGLDSLGDLHSHLVPGVDDGARSRADALAGIERLADAGVGHVLTTPHLDASILETPRLFENRWERVAEAWRGVVEALPDRLAGVRLQTGFEVMLDVPAPELGDPRVRLAGTRYVLVEWPRLRLPRGTVEVLAGLRAQGVVPIVAHPERYAGLGRHPALATEWRRIGAKLQVNHGSLHGRYGREARERALDLLRRGCVDVLSSDYHARSDLPLFVAETRDWFGRLGMSEAFVELASANPRRIMEDEELLAPVPLEIPQGLWTRVKSLFHLDRGEP